MSTWDQDLTFAEGVSGGTSGAEYHKIATLWALRILVRLGGYKRFPQAVMDEAEVLTAVGVKTPQGSESVPATELKRQFSLRLAKMEQRPVARIGALGRNLKLLAKSLSLSSADCKVLAFAVVIHNVGWLESAAETLGRLDRRGTVAAIAKVLGMPIDEVRHTLDPGGILANTSILRVSVQAGDLKSKLELLDGFTGVLTQPHRNATELLRPFFRYPPAAKLRRSDYIHARAEWSLISEYLRAALDDKHAGVNILIHGRPGTGKTELVRSLVAEQHLKLCEVATEDSDGDALIPDRRLGAYLLAQRALRKAKHHVLLFDEIEDAFPVTANVFGFLGPRRESVSKAWMNRMLEENAVPCFWLSNHVEQMDPAYLRRFDLVVQMPEITRSVRRNVLQRYLKGIPVSEPWLARMSEDANLVPAMIERAAKVVSSLRPVNGAAAEERFEFILRGSLEAMGHSAPRRTSRDEPIPYRLDYLNPDQDLTGIVEGLKCRRQGRLCLYGPPGTGKTAFGKHLARELDRPLLVKRASDLLSMWVGGTEKGIARMFREAEHEGAVLLLDEADSFLRDRAGAQRSWEVTQVNELLTQMEAFGGVFVASTNLMDNLDSASLRRFDFKVKFGYLTVAQRETMFRNILSVLGIVDRVLMEDVRKRLDSLDNLTLGDFAVLVRQSMIQKEAVTQETLLAVIAQECRLKNRGTHRPAGFTADIKSR